MQSEAEEKERAQSSNCVALYAIATVDEETLFEFFHGTDYKTAVTLSNCGTKITARGKGELGGGFYMTHNQYHAAHIADYYTGSEKRGPSWGVVKFTVRLSVLKKIWSRQYLVLEDDFKDYHTNIKKNGTNHIESDYPWTCAEILDKQTPYFQHLFAGEGLLVLNDVTTTRELILWGAVGIEKRKYLDGCKGYDRDSDEMLEVLIWDVEAHGVEEGKEDEDDEDEAPDYEYFEGRVEKAKETGGKLLKSVIVELEKELREYEGDEKLQAMLDSLR